MEMERVRVVCVPCLLEFLDVDPSDIFHGEACGWYSILSRHVGLGDVVGWLESRDRFEERIALRYPDQFTHSISCRFLERARYKINSQVLCLAY